MNHNNRIMAEKGIRANVNQLFDQYVLDAFEAANHILGIGQQFASIGIVITAIGLFMIPQRRADLLSYLKWVPLALLLLNYKIMVWTIFEFYEGLGRAFQSNDLSWDILHYKIMGAQIKAMEGTDGNWSLLNLDAEALESLAMGAMTFGATSISSVISVIVFVGIKALSIVYLFVLIAFGPLNIGLSFIPAFSGMWKAWLQKFMSVCLWIPILYLIDHFLLQLMDRLIEVLLYRDKPNLGMVLTTALLLIMNVFVYLKAPTLSNFIVQGMQVSANHFKDRTKHYTKKAVQAAADTKSGGLTKGIRTMIQ
ncbi:hypothetical protein NYZ99_15405 [Maribacter litopenaei]|uniref:Conjugative transposon TraJ C-terminal domain-containing protein n=1 Tax=Maribacter litopenaei TaxID=2976127 RepID=A0ABY5Y6L4_9FLAO|nr:hypothetical protein [Maribacter litopenaei]UWX54324.1 hypothetical protein NYZ99_15405 [Maribacter litopenaei]